MWTLNRIWLFNIAQGCPNLMKFYENAFKLQLEIQSNLKNNFERTREKFYLLDNECVSLFNYILIDFQISLMKTVP